MLPESTAQHSSMFLLTRINWEVMEVILKASKWKLHVFAFVFSHNLQIKCVCRRLDDTHIPSLDTKEMHKKRMEGRWKKRKLHVPNPNRVLLLAGLTANFFVLIFNWFFWNDNRPGVLTSSSLLAIMHFSIRPKHARRKLLIKLLMSLPIAICAIHLHTLMPRYGYNSSLCSACAKNVRRVWTRHRGIRSWTNNLALLGHLLLSWNFMIFNFSSLGRQGQTLSTEVFIS